MKPRRGNLVQGFWLLMRGSATGMEEFGNTVPAFATSLAPLVAFPLVGSILIAMRHEYWIAGIMFCSRLVGVLLQPVIVEFASSRFGGRQRWLMTSTALNWSIWLALPLLFVTLAFASALTALGLPPSVAAASGFGLLAGYMIWLQWFIVKSGLRIAGWQAVLVIAVITVAVVVVYVLPYLLDPGLLAHLINLPAANVGHGAGSSAASASRSVNAR